MKSLRYRVDHLDTTTYDVLEPVGVSRPEFEAELRENVLTCQMLAHYAAVSEARNVVERYLRAWELSAALRLGRGELLFRFEDSELIDRNPPPPGSRQVVVGSVAVAATAAMSGALHVTRRNYPAAPTDFVVTPNVETMWMRFEGYLDGREPLLAMAYFCLTVVEQIAGGRAEAARLLSVHVDILRKLGEFTSTLGDAATARKSLGVGAGKGLTNLEKSWVEAAVKLLIGRVAASAGGGSAVQLTLADLPQL